MMKGKSKRPILWISGKGLPRGTMGRELSSLRYPLLWEPIAQETVPKIGDRHPVLVIVETSRMTAKVRKLLTSIEDLYPSRNFAIFLLTDRNRTRGIELADGVFMKGRGVAKQITAALHALEAAIRFESEGNKVQRQVRRLRSELDRLRNLVVRDDLTCLYNLRFFNRSLDTEHSRATRFGRQYSLIFMDLDGLKEVNTRYGHMAGGEVLRQLGEFLNENLRRIDIPARVGGDEFVIICPETQKVSARILAERLRQGIEELNLHGDGRYPGITASMGVASFPDDGDSPDKILERADRALYEAKARGKNSVCCWGDFPPSQTSAQLLGSVHNERLKSKSEEPDTPASEIETLTSG